MLLKLENITKRYDSVGGVEASPVLDSLNLAVEAGESVAIVGPSGSGKTTLLNIIGSLDQPTAGSVELEGQNLDKLSASQLAQLRNQKIGFIFQLHHLLPQCSVLENVLLPTLASAQRDQADQLKQRALQLIERVGLTDRKNYRPDQLSGGQRQRVAVVRALINKPKLLLADEPTGALDHANAENLVTLLRELNREEEIALVVVTHATQLVADFDRILTLDDGTLRQEARSS